MNSLVYEIDELKVATKILPAQVPHGFIPWMFLAVALISIALSTYTVITIEKMNTRLDNQLFSHRVSQYADSTDLLSPEVGVVQFMKRGYTVEFNRVSYTSNGMEVSGVLGNPTQLTLSDINLNISARPFPYQVKDKIEKDPLWIHKGDFEIGSAQTSIHSLSPGKPVPFSMTIPNVQQTKDGLQLAVRFTNEQYSYGY